MADLVIYGLEKLQNPKFSRFCKSQNDKPDNFDLMTFE